MMYVPVIAMGGAQEQQSPAFLFIWLGLMFVIMYVILIRPQKRREQERQAMLRNVKSGDRVLFGGGMIGIISNVGEKSFSIKIADKVKVEVVRGSITQLLDKGAEIPDDVPQR